MNFENLYFFFGYWSQLLYFLGLLNKCCVLKVFVSLYYWRFVISISPFPVVFVEGPRLLLQRLKRPLGVHDQVNP